jgi:hypothetical protein
MLNVALNSAVGRAMAVQVKRTRRDQTPQDIIAELRVKLAQAERERDNALTEVERLNAENDTLALKAHRARKTSSAADSDAVLTINGRQVVNQVEAAKRLNVPQWKISRWMNAGKFEKVAVPGRKKPMIAVDSLTKPEPGKPGRKKK